MTARARDEGWSAGTRSTRPASRRAVATGTAAFGVGPDRPGDAIAARPRRGAGPRTRCRSCRRACRGFGLPNLRRNVCPHFYMTGSRGADPDPGAAPAQGAHPPGRERLALPAARRRPPRPGLRQRRLPHPALQPVRLLRGRADPGVTARVAERDVDGDLDLRTRRCGRSQERGRFGIRLGLGRTRALLARARRPAAGRARCAGGRDERQGQRPRAGRAARSGRPGCRVGETPKPHLVSYRERIQVDGRPIDAADFARLVARGRSPPPTGSRGGSAPPTEFELLTAVVFRWFAEVRRRPRPRRGRARRAARRDPRLGRRRGRDHQRRSRPHGPARADDHGASPARRRRSSSAATWP